MQLNRLGKTKSAELIRSIVGEFTSNPIIEKIVDRADGIPLFIEELTKSVVEHALASNINDIPETLQATLLARIDRLQSSAKDLAQTAASIGREFDRDLLQAATSLTTESIDTDLSQLLQAELIVKTGSLSAQRYLFKHALVQEAVYDTMLRETRRQRHSSIADALAQSDDTTAASAETLARHYQEANRIDEAVDRWRQAGLGYASQSSNAEAVTQFENGLSALSELEATAERDSRMLSLRIAMTGPMVASHGFTADRTLEHIGHSLELAKRTGETHDVYPILYGRYISHCLGGKVDKACQFADEFVDLAATEKIPELSVLGHRIRGQALLLAGQTRTALDSLNAAMEIDIPEDRAYPPFHFGQDIQTAPMLYLAWTCAYLGRIDEALQWTERAIDRARALQHPNTTGYVLIHNALVYGWLDLRDRLDDTMAEWRALDESEHVPVWRPFFLLVDAHRQCRREEWTAVIDTMAKIRTGYIEKIKLKAFIVEIYARAAQANIALGQYDDALALIEEGCEHSAETSEQFFLPDVLHQRAALASLQSGGDASTDQAWQDALAKAESTDAVLVKLQICTSYSQYLAKLNIWQNKVKLKRPSRYCARRLKPLPQRQSCPM